MVGTVSSRQVPTNGAVEVWSGSTETVTVNGQWLKPYLVGQPTEKAATTPFQIQFKSEEIGQAIDLKETLFGRQPKFVYFLYLRFKKIEKACKAVK